MGRAGSGGGGGHSSSGHSSSRSSGGHHSSSSSSRAGSGSSSYGRSSYSSSSYHRNDYDRGYHSVYNRGYNHSRHKSNTVIINNGTPSVKNAIVSSVTLIILVIVLFFMGNAISGKGVVNTRDRDKLTGVPAFNSKCVTDELDWFDNVSQAGKRLDNFYDKTGIQPYVYLKAYDSELRTDSEKEAFANELFDELGLAENTFLYVYFAEKNESDVGYMCYVNGKQVDSIMDAEAVDIFWGYIDKYWYTDLSTDSVFQNTFDDTAKTIMTKSKTTIDLLIPVVIGVIVIGSIVGVLVIMKTKRKNEAEKAKETERILNSSMNNLVNSSESDPLIDKYNNQ